MINSILQTLYDLPLSQWIRESAWAFPTFESAHVVCISFVVGVIMIVDLRLLGAASRSRSVAALTRSLLPWTWVFFALALIFGFLLFCSNATGYFNNFPFRLKMVTMAIAGLNMAIFHTFPYRSIADWDNGPTPTSAKVAGGISLLAWGVIVVAGRWIGFTIG